MSKWSLHKLDDLGWTFTVRESIREAYRIQVTYEALALQHKIEATETNALGVAKQRYERFSKTHRTIKDCIKKVEDHDGLA